MALLIFILMLSLCLKKPFTFSRSVIGRGKGKQTNGFVKHVIHIGVDGLKPDCLLNATDGANNILIKLGKFGSSTLTNARTTIETVSAPGWSAHLCAMDSTESGITSNGWVPPWSPYNGNVKITPITGKNQPLPTVFSTIKQQDANIRTAMFYDWDWFEYLGNKSVKGSLDYEYFCNPDAEGGYGICDFYTCYNATNYLTEILNNSEGSYTFVYFGNLDEVGHEKAWCSDAYEDELHKIDEYVGKLIELIENKEISNETLIVLSTDHGGEPGQYNHGYQDDNCLIIPMFVRGPRVKSNYVISKLVHNMDIVPTAIHALGLAPHEAWAGKPISEIFQSNP